jgi:class 3 adenylate cyclase/tetratricopeptide (TPR) repeat protein
VALSEPTPLLAGAPPRARIARATVLFADLVGFTALAERVGPESAYLTVSGALRLLDGVARRHGGSVDKYLGDALMVVFGHPVPVAEPARAAARTALEMRAQLHEYAQGLAAPLELVVGINTGPLVAGDVRGRVIREFHVLGDAVNVAARLKSRAPRGAVYVGPETRREAGDAFEWTELGSTKLKGKAEEIAIFELVRSLERRAGTGLATGASVAGSPLAGRQRELAALTGRLDALAGGRGGGVLVIGPEGSGKSRLLAEADRVRRVAAVHACAEERRTGVLLADLLETLPAGAGPAAAAALRAGTARGPAAVALAAAALREAAAGQGLAVVLEDVQRADPSSLALLPALVEEAEPHGVLFVMTLRPEGEALVRPLEAGGAERIVLAPLTRDESAALVEAVAGEPLATEAKDLLLERAAGNPARLLLGVFLEPALHAERELRRHDQRTSDAERRRATILFADITGFTAMTERMGAERAYPIVVGCLQRLDEVARKHGGTVEKYLGDCVMALFGVPEAIEDAPRAAVNAAIEMRRSVRAYSEGLGEEARLDVHSGINTGLAIAGDISGPMLREFAVMGKPVSIADALKDLAPAGHVYVGEDVERATREVFRYRALEPRELEGEKLRGAFELLSEHEKLHRARIGAERKLFSPLVGRERELTALRGALARLRAGGGGVASVIAEAGLGKSRLMAEVAASEEARGLTWLEGRSLSTGRHQSFHPIADLVRSWAGIGDEDDEDRARARLEAAIRGTVPDEADADGMLPFVATLLGLPPDEATRRRLAGIEAGALEKLILRSVGQLLRAGSRQVPIVVVMDDLHWADLSSVELLEALLPLGADHAVLFVNLFRPGFERTSERLRARATLEHADRHLEIALQPLDASAARSLLHHLFRQGELPHATRQRIEERAQGNPFYIEEVVRSLLDEGAVEFADGRFRATAKIHDALIPATIQEVIMARVDGQPLRRRQVLQTACVIGGTFHRDVLAAILGDEAQLTADLQDLLDAEFLVPSDRLPGEEYAFKHPLIQEVAYEGLLSTRRQELHGKVGEAIERVLPAELPGYTGMLAYHYGKAGAVERAEEFLFRAGAEAARAAAPSEALYFFEEASKLYVELHGDGGDPAKRALLESNVARALYFRGRFVDAIEHFDRALALLGDRVVRGGLRAGARFGWNLALVLARLYGPRWRGVRAATDRDREIFALRYARAEATVTALPTRHLFDSMDGMALLQRLDPASVPRSGMFYAGCAALFAFGGISFDVSRRLGAQAQALVHDADPDEALYEQAMRFTARVLEGDWADAHEIDPQQLEDGLRRGQLWGPTTYLGLLGEKRIHRGEFDAALDCIRWIDEIRDQFRFDLAQTNFDYLRTLLPLERGDWPAAVEAADTYYDQNPEELLHILALSAKAKAQTQLGALEAAQETLRHAGELMASSAPVPPFHASAYHRSRLLFDVAQLERAGTGAPPAERRRLRAQARRSARGALRSAGRVAWRRTEVLRLAGQLRALAGDRHGALRLFRRSLEAGRALGARPETARTCEALGRLLRETGGREGTLDAVGWFAHARETYRALDLAGDLARLDFGIDLPAAVE